MGERGRGEEEGEEGEGDEFLGEGEREGEGEEGVGEVRGEGVGEERGEEEGPSSLGGAILGNLFLGTTPPLPFPFPPLGERRLEEGDDVDGERVEGEGDRVVRGELEDDILDGVGEGGVGEGGGEGGETNLRYVAGI